MIFTMTVVWAGIRERNNLKDWLGVNMVCPICQRNSYYTVIKVLDGSRVILKETSALRAEKECLALFSKGGLISRNVVLKFVNTCEKCGYENCKLERVLNLE